MRRSASLVGGVAAVAALHATTASALAHGVQGRADTPVPISAFFYAAAAVVVVSFLGLALGWSRPRFGGLPSRRAPLLLERIVFSRTLVTGARALVLAGFVFLLAAAMFGSTLLNHNIAPLAIFVVWWVGLVPLSVTCGNVWRELNPWATLARLARLGNAGGRANYPPRLGVWPAVVLLAGWAWLELVYPTSASPRLIAAVVACYTALTLAGMARYGIDTWLDRGEVFSVYTRTLAHLSPVQTRVGEHGARELYVRAPVLGVTQIVPIPGMIAFVGVLVGTVTFDGLSGSRMWAARDVAAAERLIDLGLGSSAAGIAVATVGLAVTLAVLVASFELLSLASSRIAGWRSGVGSGRAAMAFVHSLIPIALAYFVAHYFTLFVFQSQDLLRLASDPFGTGANWFGTADRLIDFQVVSPNAIWALQVTAILVGHVVALALAHDRALQLGRSHREAVLSQAPMLVLMVTLTVAGLWSLSEGMAAV